jgi:hypothetical protein
MAHPTSHRFFVQLLAVLGILGGLAWENVCAGLVKSTKGVSHAGLEGGDLNVIRIRFDTLKLKPGETFVLMPVKWSYSLPKPHDFRAFNVHFAVDPAKVILADFLTQGTASDAMQGTPFTNNADTDARFVILGSQEPDFTNPVLFYVRASVHLNPGEITPFHWTYVEDPKYFKIDTIITEDGWIEMEAPKNASLTSRDTTMKADTVISIPVSISDLSGTGITQARLSATVDTSVFDFVAATPGPTSGAQITSAGLIGTSLTIDIASKTTAPLPGNGVLVNVQLRSKSRQDTVCSTLQNGSFKALNSDANIGSVAVWFGEICVFGSRPASVAHDPSVEQLEVYPNPASGRVHLGIPGSAPVSELRVYDMLGRQVFAGSNLTDWDPASGIPDGRYHIRVKDHDGKTRVSDVTIVR